MIMPRDAESIQAVLRLRTLGPSGLTHCRSRVIDCLETLVEDEDGPITELDIGMWGPSMRITQTTN